MNSDVVFGKFKQWKSQMWLLWAEWFDDDCAWVAGSNHYLSGVMQEDYGKSVPVVAAPEAGTKDAVKPPMQKPDKLH
ncbi:CsbD family protein [Sodalis sp. RH21]|uniref:CsbD family protein n=1 Tax=unclassified Sodalis (in: enterobacteria) TaxID=2636512 RepID=UPI0039B466DB